MPQLILGVQRLMVDRYDALLFDCDGTLADTMPLHYAAWQKVLVPRGVRFDRERYMALAGMPTRDILALLSAEQGIPLDFIQLLPEKEGHYLATVADTRPIVPVVAVAEAWRHRTPMAVVSGGVRRAVERTLDVLGIRPWFSTVICAEDTTRGKPDPEPFRLAAERLSVSPARCLVFEDGELGLQAAHAAGMDAVDIRAGV